MCQENTNSKERTNLKQSVWKAIATSVFGAPLRLHRYRDAQDILLRRVLCEQHYRRDTHCND